MSRLAAPSPASALIVGVGDGLSASLARRLHADGCALALAARDTAKLDALVAETDARAHGCDASDAGSVAALFDAVDGRLDLVVYNPSARVRGPLVELDPEAVRRAVEVTAHGAFLVGQQAARRMLAQAPDAGGVRGTILFTGASAGVKGFAESAPFAMGNSERDRPSARARDHATPSVVPVPPIRSA